MTIALSSVAAFTAAVAAAQSVDFASYTLRSGAVRDALEAAAAAGARVRVRLERDPYDGPAAGLHRANSDSLARLAAAGADAAPNALGAPALHIKAAVVDGVAWLDDRNWADDGRETILRDTDHADVEALAAALDGRPGDAAALATTKADAQRLELGVVAAAGTRALALATESFGTGAVYDALLARARAGDPTRLLVCGREAGQAGPAGSLERQRLARLAALGVAVRLGDARGGDGDEKLAVTAGSGWVGSANATYARGSNGAQRDWGLTVSEPAMIDGLAAAFEAGWSLARPLGTTSGAGFGRAHATRERPSEQWP